MNNYISRVYNKRTSSFESLRGARSPCEREQTFVAERTARSRTANIQAKANPAVGTELCARDDGTRCAQQAV